ncbi:MAG: HAD-IIB family hydrolase [Bacterioplanes sp.]|nr:HAD-IIB family hydrolase [Bacterioplanes sp.]
MTWMVFTDLDGTLLNHDDYSYHAAESVLAELRHTAIPVVIVTSKTRAEVEPLWRTLQLNCPFVVENGAAIYAPLNSVWVQNDWGERSGLACHVLAEPFDSVMQFIDQLEIDCAGQFQRFSQLSSSHVAHLTGLSTDAASLSLQREFSDPLYWLGDDETLSCFIERLSKQGCECVCGGRFVHVLQGINKGKAVRYVTELMHRLSSSQLTTIALGDGGNDVSMLEAADMAVRVRSLHHDFPDISHTHLYSTDGVGPVGWAEAIRHFILPESSDNKR